MNLGGLTDIPDLLSGLFDSWIAKGFFLIAGLVAVAILIYIIFF